MIRRQYIRGRQDYFNNFINAHNSEDIVDDALKVYNAKIAKSKHDRYKINVKWHDDRLYVFFVLRWA